LVVARDVAGELLLVPIRRRVADLHSIYALNDAAATVWNLADGNHTISEIRDRLLEQYEVEPERAAHDIAELMTRFLELGLVEAVGD
jgi:hypothetical protein